MPMPGPSAAPGGAPGPSVNVCVDGVTKPFPLEPGMTFKALRARASAGCPDPDSLQFFASSPSLFSFVHYICPSAVFTCFALPLLPPLPLVFVQMINKEHGRLLWMRIS